MNLRVLLIEHGEGRATELGQALIDYGCHVAARLTLLDGLPQQMEQTDPDMVIVNTVSPGRDILESLRSINRSQPTPIIMFAQNSDKLTTEEAVKAGVSAYVIDGFDPTRLVPIMEVAVARFREIQALRGELEQTRNKLEDRKQIDKAKGILMKQKCVSEDEAYQALRKMAMDKNLKMVDVARNVISVAELLN